MQFQQQTHRHQSNQNEALNVIIQKNKTNYQLFNFYYGALCSPSQTTLKDAIQKNFLITRPAIEKLSFSEQTVDSLATDLGHMDQERRNLQSTKLVPTNTDKFRIHENISIQKQYETISTIIPFTAKEMTYGDLTGAFPYTSSRGAKYLYLIYDYDANAILVHSLKSRQSHEIRKAWEILIERLTSHGHTIKKFILDNECSQDLRKTILKNNLNFQLVPPHIHRQNAAERAIRTFK